MKIRRIITAALLAALAIASCGACLQQTTDNRSAPAAQYAAVPRIAHGTVDDLYKLLGYREGRYPLVSAHRGGPAPGYPENAMATFERMANIQPAIIECDIQMTRDSVLILMHDEDLDRTTNATGRIADRDFAELANVRLRDNEGTPTDYGIPTLAEALQWGVGKVVFTLDVKRGVPYSRVVEEIRKHDAAHISVVITYNANQAAEVHALAPELMISASIRSEADLRRLNRLGVPNDRLIAFVGTREADPSTYEILHRAGISTILGTMGNLDTQAVRQGNQRYAEFVRRGADILSTDRPIEAGDALQRIVIEDGLSSPFIQ